LVPRRILFSRLGQFMARQGYNIVDESVGDCVLWLSDGESQLVLRVVEEAASKDELMSTVIQAAFDAATGKTAYIALPLTTASKIGEQAFRIHGIGMLVYDSHNVVELVPAKARKLETRQAEEEEGRSAVAELPTQLEEIIHSLSARMSRLEASQTKLDVVDQLMARLERLERMYEQLKQDVSLSRKPQRPEQAAAKPTPPAQAAKREEALPSFLRENPWLDILSNKSA